VTKSQNVPQSIYLATPMNATLDQKSTTTCSQTSRRARRSRLDVAEMRRGADSLEQRQRVMVWWLMALLWILFLIAITILLERAS
jgi:hypothetical protein